MKPILLFAALAAYAQPPSAFEAASIKPNTSEFTSMKGGRGQIEITNISFRRLILQAYRLHDFSYSAPAWLDSVHFDIVAKLPADGKPSQVPEMLQTLLAGRFHLAVHREQREMNGLALTAGKKGARVQQVNPPSNGGGSGSGPNMVQGTGISMAEMANLLSNSLDRPVEDATNLSGVYNINLRWLPDNAPPGDPSGLPVSVFAAAEELGLRLEVRKLTVDVLVVDSIARAPTGQ